jgi:hypothetical protein
MSLLFLLLIGVLVALKAFGKIDLSWVTIGIIALALWLLPMLTNGLGGLFGSNSNTSDPLEGRMWLRSWSGSLYLTSKHLGHLQERWNCSMRGSSLSRSVFRQISDQRLRKLTYQPFILKLLSWVFKDY